MWLCGGDTRVSNNYTTLKGWEQQTKFNLNNMYIYNSYSEGHSPNAFFPSYSLCVENKQTNTSLPSKSCVSSPFCQYVRTV